MPSPKPLVDGADRRVAGLVYAPAVGFLSATAALCGDPALFGPLAWWWPALLGAGIGAIHGAAPTLAGNLFIDQGATLDPAFVAMTGDATITYYAARFPLSLAVEMCGGGGGGGGCPNSSTTSASGGGSGGGNRLQQFDFDMVLVPVHPLE